MKIMGTSFRRSHACTAAVSASHPEAGHRQLFGSEAPELLPPQVPRDSGLVATFFPVFSVGQNLVSESTG